MLKKKTKSNGKKSQAFDNTERPKHPVGMITAWKTSKLKKLDAPLEPKMKEGPNLIKPQDPYLSGPESSMYEEHRHYSAMPTSQKEQRKSPAVRADQLTKVRDFVGEENAKTCQERKEERREDEDDFKI